MKGVFVMTVTVDDIYSKQFIERNGAYDPDDVDNFLNDIMDTMTAMQEEYNRMKKDLAHAQSAVPAVNDGAVDALKDKINSMELQLRQQVQAHQMEVDELQKTVEMMKTQLQQARNELSEAKSNPKSAVGETSKTLEGILLNAQQFADEAISKAKLRADSIVNEAKVKADKIVGDAQGEKDILTKDIEALKKNAFEYRKGFEELLQKYSALLKDDEFFH